MAFYFGLTVQKRVGLGLLPFFLLALTACQPTPVKPVEAHVPPPVVDEAGLPAVPPLGLPPEQISIEGKIAFVSDRDGQHKVYVMNADGSGQFRLTDLVIRW